MLVSRGHQLARAFRAFCTPLFQILLLQPSIYCAVIVLLCICRFLYSLLHLPLPRFLVVECRMTDDTRDCLREAHD